MPLGSSIKSVRIWRFSLAGITAPQARWTAAHVIFEWLPADEDCGAGCGACTAFEEAGMLELYPLRDQWDEATASWTHRTATSPWSEPGAAGTDRGPFAARASHVPRTRLDFALDPEGLAMLAPWIDPATEQLSVVVVPKAGPNGTTGARMIIPARPARTSCSPPSPPAVLEIEACP